jgi:FdhD protein
MTAMATSSGPWKAVDVERRRGGGRTRDTDRAATEAPLEIRLHGQPFVMTMRTPGDDLDLTAGFLLSEGVISDAGDLAGLTETSAPDDQDGVVDVTLAPAAAARLDDLLASRRHVTATSACGVCGRQSAAALAFEAPPITAGWTVPAAVVDRLPARLREAQATFEQTGGLHAAGVFALDGALVEAAEDVGRHNAVDKVVGRLLRRGALPLSAGVLCVSGRASFELVQKAVRAGLPMLVAVSAPSTMAIALARDRNVTLAGFVRGDGFNVYAHAHRII